MDTSKAIIFSGVLIALSILSAAAAYTVNGRYQLFVSSSAAFRIDTVNGGIEWCIPEVRQEGVDRLASYVCQPITEERYLYKAF